MAPAGFPNHIVPFVAKARCAPHIACNSHPFVERRPEQIKTAELLHNAIARPVVIQFRNETAEHLVPDNEDACIIGIQIARIGRMMNAVVRGGVHDSLKPARTATNHFCMNPELVDEVEPATKENHRGREDQEQRQSEKKGQADKAGPSLPKRS